MHGLSSITSISIEFGNLFMDQLHRGRLAVEAAPAFAFRPNVPLHRQTTSCLETLAFIIALYHFVTGGYLTVRGLKEFMLEGRRKRTFSTGNNGTQEITTLAEAFDHLILPFACQTAYQALCCVFGLFLANAIGHKNDQTAPKCQQWLLWMSTVNVNAVLVLYGHIDFYVLCWSVVRSLLETCAVAGFMVEIKTDEEAAALRQNVLDRFRARAAVQPD